MSRKVRFRQYATNRDLFLEVIREEIEEALTAGKHFSLDTVASEMCVSRRTLSRRLNYFGVSFRQISELVKKETSAHLLMHSDLPVTAISEVLGYRDASNFAKAFRRWWDCTPRGFRYEARAA